MPNCQRPARLGQPCVPLEAEGTTERSREMSVGDAGGESLGCRISEMRSPSRPHAPHPQ
jgi:hypothetical protein